MQKGSVIRYVLYGVVCFTLGSVTNLESLYKPLFYSRTPISQKCPRDIWNYNLKIEKNNKGELELKLGNKQTQKYFLVRENGHAGTLKEEISEDLARLFGSASSDFKKIKFKLRVLESYISEKLRVVKKEAEVE